jgi:carboxypeptidase Taq
VRLVERFRRLAHFRDAEAILYWDRAVMMPPGAGEARAAQLAALDRVRHKILAGEETGALIEAAGAGDELGPWEAANLREMRHAWRHATAIDEALSAALVTAGARCEMVWREARANCDFETVRAEFAKLLKLVREAALAKAAALGLDPYDALLDAHDPGLDRAAIDPLFAELSDFLPPLLERVLARQTAEKGIPTPGGPIPAERQRALGLRIMDVMGIDSAWARLDTSAHPFCGGTPEDIRITTRFDERDFASGLFAVVHEAGHALYERGLPEKWRDQPVGAACGTSVHESQSLLMEMMVGRSRAFAQFAAPLFREVLGVAGPAWEADALYGAFTRIEAGLVRVEADEVSYPLHVILRYQLEAAMVAGTLEAADLPGAWNEGMERLLGRVPSHDGEGCLQDIHWYQGAFGYFPAYAIGAALAAQFFAAAIRADPEIEPAIGRGDLTRLSAWLADNVRAKASFATPRELVIAATGKPLDATDLRRHLEARYLEGAT